MAWGVYATSVMIRRAAAQVLEGASRNERLILFCWRFLAQWIAFVGFIGLMAAGIAPAWAAVAVLACLAACVAFVRPIRAFTFAWFRSLPQPWDRP